MKNRIKNLFCGVLSAVLAGCVTPRSLDEMSHQNYDAGERYGDSEGYLVCSVSISEDDPSFDEKDVIKGFRYSKYKIGYTQVLDSEDEKPVKGSLIVNEVIGMQFLEPLNPFSEQSRVFAEDFRDQEEQCFLFSRPLPAGRYRLDSYALYHSDSVGYKTFYLEPREEIVFEIVAGEATYIGELEAFHVYSKGMLGNNISNGGYFLGSNEIDRDRSELVDKYSFLSKVKWRFEPIHELVDPGFSGYVDHRDN